MRPLCAFVLLLLLFYPFAVRGQTTDGSIAGRVTDTSKATVADAKVAAVKLGTNFRYETTTNGAGEYTLAFDDQGQFGVNGQRADANHLTVDGASAHFGVTGCSPHATATINRALNNNLLLWSTVPNPSRDRVGPFSSSLRPRNMGEIDRRSVIGFMRLATVQRNAENQQQSLQENCDSGQWWVQPAPLYLGS